MKYNKLRKALILLADGTIFHGKSVGNKEGTAFGEVCFNTGMTGYQEVFTDPSYFGQLMVTTNAHIGNYGVNANEIESDTIKIAGLICKNFSYNYSRDAANDSLKSFFEKNDFFYFLKSMNIINLSFVYFSFFLNLLSVSFFSSFSRFIISLDITKLSVSAFLPNSFLWCSNFSRLAICSKNSYSAVNLFFFVV